MSPIAPSVDRHFLLNVAGAMTRIGIDVPQICAEYGLANPLHEQGERVPLAMVSSLYEVIGSATHDPEFIYKLGSSVDFSGAGTLFQLVTCCENLFTALQLVSRYSSVAIDAVKCSFGEQVRLHVDLVVTPTCSVHVSARQIEPHGSGNAFPRC